MTQFAFLNTEFPAVFESASKAKSLAVTDPRTACFYARRTLELAVSWAFKFDSGLKLPYQDDISALIHEPTFKQIAGDAVANMSNATGNASWEIFTNLVDAYGHAERKVIFLGDFIDRGPQIQKVLEIVRPMVESGNALAVMGNPEFNALALHTKHIERRDVFLRKRNIKNIRQHGQTILQLTDEHLADAINWFGTLPMWLELDGRHS